MPEITPIAQEGTITIQANTQMPSAQMNQASQAAPQETAVPQATQEGSPQMPEMPKPQQGISEKKVTDSPSAPPQIGSEESKKAKSDEGILKARLLEEKMKRQIYHERKKLEEERKSFEIERAQSRKWHEAEELSKQGKYLEASQRAGISYEQLTQQILNNGQLPPAQVAEQTAAALVEKKFEEYKKHLETESKKSQAQQYQQSLKQLAKEAKYFVDNTDKYPLAKSAEPYQAIVKNIETEYHRTGRVMPVEEAIQRWEDETLEGLRELAKLDKVRNNVFQANQQPLHQQPERVPTTLSQKTMASVPAPRGMTEQERRQRAVDAFYGKLIPG